MPVSGQSIQLENRSSKRITAVQGPHYQSRLCWHLGREEKGFQLFNTRIFSDAFIRFAAGKRMQSTGETMQSTGGGGGGAIIHRIDFQ